MDKWKKLFKLYVRALPLSIATTLVAIHTFVLCLIYAFFNSFRTRLDGLDKQSQASVGAVSPGKDRYHFAALIVIALIFAGF